MTGKSNKMSNILDTSLDEILADRKKVSNKNWVVTEYGGYRVWETRLTRWCRTILTEARAVVQVAVVREMIGLEMALERYV